MKSPENSFGRLLILAVLVTLCLGISTNARAQDNQTRKYRVTAYNAMDTKISSTSNIAEVAPGISLYLPNTFSPNGDGLNDLFGATGEGISSYSIKVFNKWGELVFESNDIGKKWDGQFKGSHTDADVFVYQVSAKGITGGAVYKKGTVTVIR